MHKDARKHKIQTMFSNKMYAVRSCGFLLIIFRGNLIYFYYDEIVSNKV